MNDELWMMYYEWWLLNDGMMNFKLWIMNEWTNKLNK